MEGGRDRERERLQKINSSFLDLMELNSKFPTKTSNYPKHPKKAIL
jgi:hypothetical protein